MRRLPAVAELMRTQHAVMTLVRTADGGRGQLIHAGAVTTDGDTWEAWGSGRNLGEFETRRRAEIAVRRAWWGPRNRTRDPAEQDLFGDQDGQ